MILLDTNILLRLKQAESAQHTGVVQKLRIWIENKEPYTLNTDDFKRLEGIIELM